MSDIDSLVVSDYIILNGSSDWEIYDNVDVRQGGTLVVGNNVYISELTVEGNSQDTLVHVEGNSLITYVELYGKLILKNDARSDNVNIFNGGKLDLNADGIANGVTINSGGTLKIDGGIVEATTTAPITLNYGAIVETTSMGGNLQLKAARDPWEDEIYWYNPLISNKSGKDPFSYFSDITLTIDQNLSKGTYILAEGVNSFSKTISVIVSNATSMESTLTPAGNLSLGSALNTSNATYSLSCTNKNLYLTISAPGTGGGGTGGGGTGGGGTGGGGTGGGGTGGNTECLFNESATDITVKSNSSLFLSNSQVENLDVMGPASQTTNVQMENNSYVYNCKLGGEMVVKENSFVEYIKILNGGKVDLNADGAAKDIYVASGGILKIDGGSVYVSDYSNAPEDTLFNERIRGLYIDSKATIEGSKGTLKMFIGKGEKRDEPLVVNMGKLSSAISKYELHVEDSVVGDYILGSGISSFSKTITVYDDTDDYARNIGTLSTSKSLNDNLYRYSLKCTNSTLVLSVSCYITTTVFVGDYATLSSLEHATIGNQGYCYVFNGNVSDIKVAKGGILQVDNGGAENITIDNNGTEVSVQVENGGVVINASLSGMMVVKSNAEVSNITVNNGGKLDINITGIGRGITVNSGGILKIDGGTLQVDKESSLVINTNAKIEVEDKGELKWVVDQDTGVNDIKVNNLNKIQTAIEDFVFFSQTSHNYGKYALASGVTNFSQYFITLQAENDADGFVSLSSGPVVWRDDEYSLSLTSGTLYLTVAEHDGIPPEPPKAQASIQTPTAQNVVVTATFSADSDKRQYSLDNQNWQTYTTKGVTMTQNGTVYFRGIDKAGNISQVTSYTVSNIDKISPVIQFKQLSGPDNNGILTISISCDDSKAERFYSTDGTIWNTIFNDSFTVSKGGMVYLKAIDQVGNVGKAERYLNEYEVSFNSQESTNISGSGSNAYKLTWSASVPTYQTVAAKIAVGNSQVILQDVPTDGFELYNVPAKKFTWSMKSSYSNNWSTTQTADQTYEISQSPMKIQCQEDSVTDIILARAHGTWSLSYEAFHDGIANRWEGTKETAALGGKNVLADVVYGSKDSNLLLLTNDANGDALFFDDIFTVTPEGVQNGSARLSQIDTIYAGDGDDLIDLTSPDLTYNGSGMEIHGGQGNDVIWANNGSNLLFGDAGNDRLVGGADNDILVGGSGNDSLHGGGGDDIFCFCNNWGQDTVEQLAGGKVTLWFANGDSSKWNKQTMTYKDGSNTVKVSGVADVTLKFGNSSDSRYDSLLAAGAFSEFTNDRFSGNLNNGMLA